MQCGFVEYSTFVLYTGSQGAEKTFINFGSESVRIVYRADEFPGHGENNKSTLHVQ